MRFSYIFNQDEFKMLLALAGYKKLYGYSLENKIISADCAGYAFNNLYKEKIIIKNLNGFKIEPEVHSALKTIGEFEHYMIINSNDIFLNTLSCYIRNGRIVVCSGVTVSQNKVKISSFSVTQFIDFLLENSYIPKSESQIEIENVELENFEKQIDISNRNCINNKKILLNILLCNNNSTVSEIFLINYYLYDYFLIKSNDSFKRKSYTQDNFRLLIDEIVFGSKK